MTKQEIKKLIFVIKATYPKYFATFSKSDYENMIMAWQMALEDYPYSQASAGLKTYLVSDTKGFPPAPGQIIDNIHKVMPPAAGTELNGMEAWILVRKALRNSTYNAETEYEKLPEAVRRAIGGSSNLREMAALDIDRVDTVEQSHFIRTYEATVKRIKDEAKIPKAVHAAIEEMFQQAEALEDKGGVL